MRLPILISGFFILIITLVGCSSGGNLPISVDSSLQDDPVASIVGVSDWNDDGTPSGGMGLLGIFDFNIDPGNLSAEITPLRTNSLVDTLEVVDITNFLMLAPCTDCVKIASVSLNTANQVVLSLGIRHPFGVGDPLKPISGQNRADLHIFNIEGIVISDALSVIFPGLNEYAVPQFLVSADGYTSYLDGAFDDFYLTDATVHPYITHFDDYSAGNFDPANPMGFASVTDPPPSGNLVMAMGSDYDFQDYVFDLDSPVDFNFAVGCTYAVSAASKNLRFTPEYRVPQHNKKAASEVSVEIVSNELRGGIQLSSADIEIRVVDINHGVTVGGALDEMFADSSVDDIVIDLPGILLSPEIVDGNNPVSGSGHDPTDPLVYQATIQNLANGAEGNYNGLVKVSDTYLPGQNETPLLSGADGIRRVDPGENPLTGLFQIAEFQTYQAFEINVAPGCGPITGSITDPVCPVLSASSGSSISFTATASSANGGDPVILYEWDMDYDGLTFDVDGTGSTVTLGPYINPNCGTPPENPVTFTTAVRGTDSCAVPNVTVFATCDITVDICPSVDIPQNVEIVVNRLSYTEKRRIDEDGPFTISWDAPTGTPASYAIHVDRDPSDGYSSDYLFVDEVMSPTTSWTGDGIEFSIVDRYIPGWTYVVRARAIAGDPSSETDDSDQVHVMVSSFETAPGGDLGPPGLHTTLKGEEGWWANQEGAFGGSVLYTTYTYNSNCTFNSITSYGCGYVRLDLQIGRSGSGLPGRWMGMMTETPIPSTMPNITVRRLDFVTVSRGQFDYGSESGGIIIGTCPSKPVDQWTNTEILEWAQADGTTPFDGYQANNQAFIGETFDDVPMSGSNSWYYFTEGTAWDTTDKRLRGGDVNIEGNVDDPWIAIESCHSNYTDGFNPETCLDEISIAIY